MYKKLNLNLFILFMFMLINITPLFGNGDIEQNIYSRYTICIDPGHPSETSDGKWRANGISELEMNWKIAKKLEKYLQHNFQINIIMTKKSINELVTNKKRAEIANKNGAALFLRLHCDSGKSHGFTIYYPDRQGTKYGHTGPDFKTIKMSKIAAEQFKIGMMKILKGIFRGKKIKGDSQTYIGGKQGALTGSIFCKVPSILIEMGYLTNKKDADFLKSKEGSDLMVKALSSGIIDYLNYIEKKNKNSVKKFQ